MKKNSFVKVVNEFLLLSIFYKTNLNSICNHSLREENQLTQIYKQKKMKKNNSQIHLKNFAVIYQMMKTQNSILANNHIPVHLMINKFSIFNLLNSTHKVHQIPIQKEQIQTFSKNHLHLKIKTLLNLVFHKKDPHLQAVTYLPKSSKKITLYGKQ